MKDIKADIYSVSRLVLEARSLLEREFPMLRVEGELSNWTRASSGHAYFTLKDGRAQVRCALFRARGNLLRFEPKNGDQVVVRARVTLYEGRGEFQLQVEQMELSGIGLLLQQLEERKARLQAEGWFAPERKKPLPVMPKIVGVVSSPTGAAIRDVINTLHRRYPLAEVRLIPVPVQGAEAAGKIAAAIELVSQRRLCEVLLVCRGGGSLEDLWAFNEEAVARAIYHCEVPVITGIGHEIDVTLADFVADRRGATPTAAAELAVPDQVQLQGRLRQLAGTMQRAWDRCYGDRQQRLDGLQRRIIHPGQRLRARERELLSLSKQLRFAMRVLLRNRQSTLERHDHRLLRQNPRQVLLDKEKQYQRIGQQLVLAMTRLRERLGHRLAQNLVHLEALSPLQTLARGYAIVRTPSDGTVVRRLDQVAVGDPLLVRLKAGQLLCEVRDVEEQETDVGG